MKIIAHRANINGSNSSNENRLSQIRKCIELGYEVEIDIRLIDKKLYLGHDKPEDIISEKEIYELKDNCWIHCKNLDALTFFNKFGEITMNKEELENEMTKPKFDYDKKNSESVGEYFKRYAKSRNKAER